MSYVLLMRLRAGGCLALLALAGLAGGCRRGLAHAAPVPGAAAHHAPATSPTSAPAGTVYESPKHGFSLRYPAGWVPRANPDYVLMLVPASAGDSTPRSISVDDPDLPVHIPGMIPIGLVKNGYLDDLKKQFGEIQTTEEQAPTLAKTEARLMRSTYKVNGKPHSETALMLIHADHVYIIRATTDEAGYEAVRGAYDSIIKSLRWVK